MQNGSPYLYERDSHAIFRLPGADDKSLTKRSLSRERAHLLNYSCRSHVYTAHFAGRHTD